MSGADVSLLTQKAASSLPDEASPAISIRGPFRNLRLRLSVSIPLVGWKLGALCGLKEGQLLLTGISAAEDVPLRAGGALLGCVELDNVDGQMAVRLTRLRS